MKAIFYLTSFLCLVIPQITKAEYKLIPFPDISFKRPVDIQLAPDNQKLLYIVEQRGRIYSFNPKDPKKSLKLFLDIESNVSRKGNEEGLLGLAFSPEYKDSKAFYVYYSGKSPRRSVLSQFVTKNNTADPKSETVLLEIPQPYSNHNGGQIVFGPDKLLYVAVGDGGSGGDPHGNGQKLDTLLGKILRIKTCEGCNAPYSIPADNPFVNHNKAKKEIYAYGLRNPWRISFDSKTGEFWAADVGQNKYEEIDIIVSGGNYGWNELEGFNCFKPKTGCNKNKYIAPVHSYDHSIGQSVTGGFIYRGKKIKELIGSYIYGDFVSGAIWALKKENGQYKNKKLLDSGLNISSFGEAAEGELMAAAFDGKIYQLIN